MTVYLILWLAAQAASVFAVLGFCIGLGRTAALSREPAVAVIGEACGLHPHWKRVAIAKVSQGRSERI